MSINLLCVSLLLSISHVVNSAACSPTAVTTANNCCVGDLSIATTMTSIAAYAYNSGSGAFVGCGTITSVTVPSTVTTIGFFLNILSLICCCCYPVFIWSNNHQ